MGEKKGSIISGAFWMIFISILLFWLPILGPAIAGYVGGKKAGGILNAIIAALVPFILLVFAIMFLAAFVKSVFAVFAGIIGLAILPLYIINNAIIFIFAIIGGAMAK